MGDNLGTQCLNDPPSLIGTETQKRSQPRLDGQVSPQSLNLPKRSGIVDRKGPVGYGEGTDVGGSQYYSFT